MQSIGTATIVGNSFFRFLWGNIDLPSLDTCGCKFRMFHRYLYQSEIIARDRLYQYFQNQSYHRNSSCLWDSQGKWSSNLDGRVYDFEPSNHTSGENTQTSTYWWVCKVNDRRHQWHENTQPRTVFWKSILTLSYKRSLQSIWCKDV
jgi:hypothetical protein